MTGPDWNERAAPCGGLGHGAYWNSPTHRRPLRPVSCCCVKDMTLRYLAVTPATWRGSKTAGPMGRWDTSIRHRLINEETIVKPIDVLEET